MNKPTRERQETALRQIEYMTMVIDEERGRKAELIRLQRVVIDYMVYYLESHMDDVKLNEYGRELLARLVSYVKVK